MAKFFASDGRLAAAGNAALLCRAMKQRVWEDSPQQVCGGMGQGSYCCGLERELLRS